MAGDTGACEAVERAAQRSEQAQVVESPETAWRKPAQLAEDPLLRRPRDQVRIPADQRLRLRDQAKVERKLVLEPRSAQEAQGIVLEDRVPDGAQASRRQIGVAVERVGRLIASRPLGNRVDREIARRQIGFDRPGQRCEIDGAPILERDPPGAVALRERERRSARLASVEPGGPLGLAERDIDVDDLPVERGVANGAADDPGLLAGEEPLDELTN